MKRKLVSIGLALVLVTMMGIAPGVVAADDEGSDFTLVAGTYASAVVGKLLLIIDGVIDNYVRWESAGNATAPVYIIIGLTDEGKTLVETLGDLILEYARKALSDLEEASVNSTGS